MCTLPTGRLLHCAMQWAPVTIGAKFTTNVGWRAAEITPSLCDREGAYADLRLVYISVVPLATMTQAPGFCWVCAHCQRELVTIDAKFNIGANI
ncbi:hypothetical protein [Salinivibrio kushneri]|uniref:hypothetical protein n=1 Tax=Salinivibrio kushneri TaxID=1908198 RepID=UPI000C836300|nr:hypothetical protein [Salinivibrio kushneri]